MAQEPVRVELVIAKSLKLHDQDSLIVLVDPQYADYINPIYEELKTVTGHSRHTIIPVPADKIKFYKVQHMVQVGLAAEINKVKDVIHGSGEKEV